MQTITLLQSSFESLIKLAFSDGKTYGNITSDLYLSQFYDEYKALFEANKALLKPLDELLQQSDTNGHEKENNAIQAK